jgi:hypothetical protein
LVQPLAGEKMGNSSPHATASKLFSKMERRGFSGFRNP